MSMVPTLARKSLRAHIGRSIFIALSILAGVAFVSGSFILADSLKGTFDELIDGLTGEIDLEVRSQLTSESLDAARDPIPADLLETVAAVPGVDVVEGSYARYAQLIDPDGELVTTAGAPTLGVSWNQENGLSGVELREGRAPSGIDELAVDKATADRVGYELGDAVTVVFNSGQREFTLVGTIGLGSSDGFVGATTAVFDTETAAVVLDGQGEYDTIDLKVAPGADIAQVKQAIADVLPERTEVVTGEELAEETKDLVGEVVGLIATGLLIFAVITAFVAAFVINNIYGITIGQRLRELALLRAIGASGSQVRRLVVLEAIVVATIATVIGIFGGYVVAQGIIAAFNSAGGGFPESTMLLKPRTVVVSAFVGIGITVMSVLVPAIRAARIPPVAAMRPEVGFSSLGGGRRLVLGIIATAVGLSAFLVGIFLRPGGSLGLIVLGGGGALVTFLGVASLSATVARPVSIAIGAPISKVFGTGGRFARDNAARAPRRTARTASALMIGVAMISAAAVFFSSFRDTFARALDRTVTADYIVLDRDSFQPLSPEVATRLAELPELSAVSPLRSIGGDVADRSVDFNAVSATDFQELVNIDLVDGGYDDFADMGLLVYSEIAEDEGYGVGDEVPVVWQNGVESTLSVTGVFDDNSLSGNWIISLDTLEQVSTRTPTDQFVLAKLADGVDFPEATSAMRAAIAEFPQATVQTNTQFLDEQEDQINQILFLVTLLLLIAIVFSFLGIAITLALAVFERTREIGLLRAVGMSRRQLRRSVRWEAVIVALFGVAVGIVVGLIFGVALSYAVPNTVVDGITFPIGTLVLVVVVAVVAAVLAALYPAFKASRMNVLEAIATE